MIENLTLTKNDLLGIQADLNAKNTDSFERLIASVSQEKLTDWIGRQYPSLLEDKADIIFGSLRRLKNVIRKTDLTASSLDLDKQLSQFAKMECELTLPTEANKKKNLGLSKVEFKAMLQDLKNGKEELIDKVYLSRFDKCINILVRNFGCSREEAYDSSIDALLEIRQDLLNDRIRYGNLETYFINRAKLKYYRRNRNKKIETVDIGEEMEFKDDSVQEESLMEGELREAIAQALSQMGEGCQDILQQFYYEEISLNEIAEKMNKTHAAVRKQASRCRDKFRQFLGEGFYANYKL